MRFDLSIGAAQLDPSFTIHQGSCDSCQQFKPERPETAVHLCLQGAVLYKRDNTVQIKRARVPRSDNYVSKEQLRQVMRYK